MKLNLWFVSLVLFILTVSISACNLKVSSDGAENVNLNAVNQATTSGTPTSAAGEVKTASPETLVAELYKQHDAHKSPFFQTKDRAIVDRFFTKSLGDLIWKDASESGRKNEVGVISGDPLYDGQDLEIKNFVIGKGEVKGETATVIAKFSNFGENKAVTFSLKTVGGSWKIENISYGGGDSLMKWLNEEYTAKPEKETSLNGEFEGKFQVGETSCTVKPVKMAFEIRWAKGSGVEMFFFKEGNTFESSPDKGEPNSFVFDDENYNSGTFYRADGKTFAVKRAN